MNEQIQNLLDFEQVEREVMRHLKKLKILFLLINKTKILNQL